MITASPVSLQESFDAAPEVVWEQLTTAAVERWWAPEGFEVAVAGFDLRPGGQIRYSMTATGAEQVAFVRELGLPATNAFRRTFTEVVPCVRLSYLSLIDFIPDQEPYEHRTVIELRRSGDRTDLLMLLDPLHDDDWTREYCAHRRAELDQLGALLTHGHGREPRARA